VNLVWPYCDHFRARRGTAISCRNAPVEKVRNSRDAQAIARERLRAQAKN